MAVFCVSAALFEQVDWFESRRGTFRTNGIVQVSAELFEHVDLFAAHHVPKVALRWCTVL